MKAFSRRTLKKKGYPFILRIAHKSDQLLVLLEETQDLLMAVYCDPDTGFYYQDWTRNDTVSVNKFIVTKSVDTVTRIKIYKLHSVATYENIR
jgi:hypothetical protein